MAYFRKDQCWRKDKVNLSVNQRSECLILKGIIKLFSISEVRLGYLSGTRLFGTIGTSTGETVLLERKGSLNSPVLF